MRRVLLKNNINELNNGINEAEGNIKKEKDTLKGSSDIPQYPPRTAKAQEEAKKLADAMMGEVLPKKSSCFCNYPWRWTVLVGNFGEHRDRRAIEVATKLENKLSKGIDNKRYTMSSESMPMERLETIPKGN